MSSSDIRRKATAALALTLLIPTLASCGGESADSSKGQVYYINSKPEVASIWKKVASEYTKETGVEVTVQTAAAGTLDQTMASELAKSEAPTMFTLNGYDSYSKYKQYLADVSDSAVYKLLNNEGKAYSFTEGTKAYSVPFAAEWYGMIYNKAILAKYISKDYAVIKSVDEIKNFDVFKQVCDSIQAHKSDLGLDGAISNAGMDASDTYRFTSHLARIPLFYEYKDANTTFMPKIKGTYMEQFKNIWDLYLTDSTTQHSLLSSKTYEDTTSEFATGKVAFYQNGTWSYTQIQGNAVKDSDLGMLPIYIGAKDESSYGPASIYDASWAINKNSSEQDQKATLDFMKWLVSSKEGKQALTTDMGFSAPFTSMDVNAKSDNPLVTAALEYKKDKIPFVQSFALPSGQWQSDLSNALLNYTQSGGSWSAVKTAYVKNWATEWKSVKDTSGVLPEAGTFKDTTD
ncbi:ABC transporter substrate-binding protein [Bifidobacterium psychraerophilum]|uniref:Bacterial extracellular solute-binding protein n=2 Tax=Bifidobacterium psychraerophilum TaxID=218140 RepID=A0A087CJD8_9BIFI|nr:ABC transporter substrate-binding protein [Bifidobacterium psychraerophilum]KFI83388.1 Bacterial extracellular solute-binding protein [Bifidobacterium psychraerophilum]